MLEMKTNKTKFLGITLDSNITSNHHLVLLRLKLMNDESSTSIF